MMMLAVVLSLSCAAPPAEANAADAERAPGAPAMSVPPPERVAQEPAREKVEVRVTSALMKRHAGQLVVTASSVWPGWGTERLVDGNAATSWFSAKGDAAAKGKKPWVMVAFPSGVEVRKVSVFGNREPSWPKGFTIHYGTVELLDDMGLVIATAKNEGKNRLADVDFVFKAPVAGVRAVRFTSLMDDGDKTQFEDIALGEIVVE